MNFPKLNFAREIVNKSLHSWGKQFEFGKRVVQILNFGKYLGKYASKGKKD